MQLRRFSFLLVMTAVTAGLAGAGGPAAAAPIRSTASLPIVYDLVAVANVLYRGAPGVPGLRSVPTALRQYPVGEPFPIARQASKIGHRELAGRTALQVANLIRARLRTTSLGTPNGSGFVTIDEIGRELRDGAAGPVLLGAMRILSRLTHRPTGEPLARRVLLFASPLMVGNVGARNDRGTWDSSIAAARLAGGIYLQMYHARGGAITSAASAAEWRVYLPIWRRELGRANAGRLRVLLTAAPDVGQVEQWRRARQTAAGRAALRAGAASYRLGTRAEALAWLRNFNRYARVR